MPKPMPVNPTFDRFIDLWMKFLADEDHGGTVVVVEGERDRLSVRRLGWTGPIVAVHRGRTLSRTAHELLQGRRKAIVLTDWDTEGGHLAHRLREFLEAERLVLDLKFRQQLARLLRGELVHVEGLYRWARRHAEEEGIALEWILEGGLAGGDRAPTG